MGVSKTAPSRVHQLGPEEASRIAEAQRQGVDLDAVLRQVITRLARTPRLDGAAAAPPGAPVALDELAAIEAQVQQDFKRSGLSEDELGSFVSDLVHRVRADIDAQNSETDAPKP